MVNREQHALQLLHRPCVVYLLFVADGQLLHFLSFHFHHYFVKKKSENTFIKWTNFHVNLISQRKGFQKYGMKAAWNWLKSTKKVEILVTGNFAWSSLFFITWSYIRKRQVHISCLLKQVFRNLHAQYSF